MPDGLTTYGYEVHSRDRQVWLCGERGRWETHFYDEPIKIWPTREAARTYLRLKKKSSAS